MSVWLQEVVENAGYDIIENPDDARWLLAQKEEFEALCEKAAECVEDYNEYEKYVQEQQENNKSHILTWTEWRGRKYNE